MSRVLIIGGGAAGMAAAIAAAGCGHQVHIYEKNEKLGKKLFITGKGRCNVTNGCDMEELMGHVVTNARFLYSSFYGFTNRDMMELLERNGCPLKTERGGRVFPVSDKSSDVIGALSRQLKELGVTVHLFSRVTGLVVKDGVCRGIRVEEAAGGRPGNRAAAKGQPESDPGSRAAAKGLSESGPGRTAAGEELSGGPWGRDTAGETMSRGSLGKRAAGEKEIPGDRVIVATGGFSYQATGSTGDGYRFAEMCGHQVTELLPALVPFDVKETEAGQLQGLSLRNIRATVRDGKKELYREFGELLFTHFGVSGPVILSASSYVTKYLKKRPLTLSVDLKPALTPEQLDARIVRDFQENVNRQFKNALNRLYPARLIPIIIERTGISPDKKVHDITAGERGRLGEVTKDFTLTITGVRDFKEAIITQGGVAVKEIDPKTMESRLVRNLHFAGEVLDLDGVTGGFNLQIAWSTGWAAGSHIPNTILQ